MTELKDGQTLERLIQVPGISAPIIFTISCEGVSFRVKGTPRAVLASWGQVINTCSTPTNVPSFLFGKPRELLEHYAQKLSRLRKEDLWKLKQCLKT